MNYTESQEGTVPSAGSTIGQRFDLLGSWVRDDLLCTDGKIPHFSPKATFISITESSHRLFIAFVIARLQWRHFEQIPPKYTQKLSNDH